MFRSIRSRVARQRIHQQRRGSQVCEALESRRLLAAGDLDTSFSDDGKATVSFSGATSMTAHAVAVQSDGKIVVVGSKPTGITSELDFAVVRFDPDGSRDLTFAAPPSPLPATGLLTLGFGGRDDAEAVTIDYHGTAATNPFYGSIIVAGNSYDGGPHDQILMAVARLNPDGSTQNPFDGDSKLTYRYGGNRNQTEAWGVLAQPGGRMVVVGSTIGSRDPDFLLVRFEPDGTIAAGGTRTTDFGGWEDA